MKTILELTSRLITPALVIGRGERVEVVSSSLQANGRSPSANYEATVFNFLLKHKDELGIQAVLKFANLKVDGAIVLTNGRRLVLEVKLRMNWLKSCQSCAQFGRFLSVTEEARTNTVDGAIVIFEKFSGDWAKHSRSRDIASGWDRWYLAHSEVDGKRIDLLMLCGEQLEGYPG